MDEKERTRSSATAVLVCLSVCLTSMPLSSASVDRRRRVLSWTARRGVRLLLGLVRLSVSPPPRCPLRARQQRLAGPGSPSRDGRPRRSSAPLLPAVDGVTLRPTHLSRAHLELGGPFPFRPTQRNIISTNSRLERRGPRTPRACRSQSSLRYHCP
ncbi:hypothetical protein BDZ90DRAFT_165267 [Jaminaea rosea]|uniref:Uncharacterized protein n=1 Tax=Jaminaea rosea TaxID=1569628 RepID=A0A316UYI8_9BASI|nr:hypothetical protein BDZ90DRAFT_165267 [Jaminaea rosea]PWN28205.1 hypothetical protein BDZ90DRAFT_165267 [Jaminaea rosea]